MQQKKIRHILCAVRGIPQSRATVTKAIDLAKDKQARQKLVIIKEQLGIIAELLDDFREVDSFKTKDFDGMEILATGKLLEEDEEEPNRVVRKKR